MNSQDEDGELEEMRKQEIFERRLKHFAEGKDNWVSDPQALDALKEQWICALSLIHI